MLPLSEGEKDLLTNLVNFAAIRAVNGTYMINVQSASLGAPVLIIVGIGEQALALQQIVMTAAVPNESELIDRHSGHAFFKDGPSNGN